LSADTILIVYPISASMISRHRLRGERQSMRNQQQDSNTIAEGLGLRRPRTLLVKSPSSGIEISRIVCGPATVGMTSVIPATEAFALGVYQTDISYHEIWRRGHSIVRQGYAAQSMQIADLADEYSAKICGTHEVVTFCIPYAALDYAVDDGDRRWSRGLGCDPGHIDPVVTHLVASLLPALEQPRQASVLFLNYVTLASICWRSMAAWRRSVFAAASVLCN